MRIANNIMAMNAHRQLTINHNAAAKAMERLSSGYRINRAGDDAAGLAISEKMRGQIRGLKQAMRNAQDGISLIQTAEGALQETHSILQRMRELAVQAANDTNTNEDRLAIKDELDQLIAEIDRIAATTQFNTKKLLDGSLSSSLDNVGDNLTAANGIANIKILGAAAGTYTLEVARNGDNDGFDITLSANGNSQTVSILETDLPSGFGTKDITFGAFGITVTVNSQLDEISDQNTFDVTASGGQISLMIGANESENMTISIGDMSAGGLGVAGIDVTTAENAEQAVTTIDGAIAIVSQERSKLGAYQNRLEHTIANLGVSAENLQAAESRIRDVDMAQEMMNFTKYQILQQASTAMLAQANLAPQSVLQLLG